MQVHRPYFRRLVRAILPTFSAIIVFGTAAAASQHEWRQQEWRSFDSVLPSITSRPASATTRGALSLSTSSLAFGNINVGTSSMQSLTLTNAGSCNLTISSVGISGAGFNVSGISSGEVLSPGQAVVLSVTFAPFSSGSVAGANVAVASNASNSPAVVTLTGTGITNVNPTVTLSWTASTSMVTGYNVYRSSSPTGPFTTALNSSLVPTAEYVDSTVVAGQTYYYAVTAVNSGDEQSADSNVVSTTIP